ncbi:hypothetical protein CAPTEDRAFT_222699 [Capitella teleta]|uniref:Short-chain dehydrogenase n=1 Tax=Capitella teleta TaxID=283909 RepID=R7VJX8_CAPTE|nr:hypothetical protein CAPTEDRAFT_222699 [Capitella teleta]|eukprot:ELU16290.1 hypothetical protein CAPTEDRAFT_222699 [Capitella teleta]
MDLHGISKFIQYTWDSFPCLDILINNAAQTIRRPKQFFQHLVTSATRDALEPSQQNLIANEKQPVVAKRSRPDLDLALPCDANSLNEFFPTDRMDEHGQQLDLRPTNSWRSQLQDVPPSELLEVLLVNTVAPFLLTQQLRPLFLRRRESRKFIVNVSAMEGQFERVSKTKFHPHTNMAKAALNMMTRTAALGFAEDRIYMTAVDTGWVTDERPFHMARYEKQQGFQLPLDCVDGAARVYDPIVRGLQEKGTPCHAVFLKNYKPFPW